METENQNQKKVQDEFSLSCSKSKYFRTVATPFGIVEVIDLLPEKLTDSEVVIYLSPGNPGVVQIYERFLKSLFYHFGRKVRILAAGHLGHSKKDLNNKILFDYKDQVNKTIFFIEKIQKECGKKMELVLLGHSFGSFVNLLALKERPDLQVTFTFHLFPVICNMNLPFGLKMISRPILRRCASVLISKIPKATKKTIAKSVSYARHEAELAISYSQNISFIENVLFTGESAAQKLRGELCPDLLETMKNNIRSSLFVYSPVDRYTNEKVYKGLMENLDSDRFVCIPPEKKVDHAFVINEKYVIVRDIIVNELLNNKKTRHKLIGI